jgi:probable selenium-dependent hydroxylase accessory protein YqeC
MQAKKHCTRSIQQRLANTMDIFKKPSEKIESMGSLSEAFGLTGGGVISLVGAGGKTSLMFRLASEFAAAGEPVLTTTTTKIMMPTPKQSAQVVLANSLKSVLSRARILLTNHRHISAALTRLSNFPEKLSGFPPDFVDEIWDSELFRWIIVEADGAAGKSLKVPADHEPVMPPSSKYIIGVVGLKALGKPLDEDWVFRHDRYSQITGLLQGKPITESSIVAAVLHEKGLFKDSSQHARKTLFLNTADCVRGMESAKAIASELHTAKRGTVIEKIIVGKPLENQPVTACFDIQSVR